MQQTGSESPGVLRPTPLSARSLAPDLARGAMLLLIALANAHLYLYGHQLGFRAYPAGGSATDRAVTLVQMVLVDGRAYPLFALLFGYGVVQLQHRQQAAGASLDDVRRLVRRRGWWMVLIGFLHAALLFSYDIVGAYGLLGVLLAGVLIVGSSRRLLVGVGLGLVPVALVGASYGIPLPPGVTGFPASMGTNDPLVASGFRVSEWLLATPLQALLVASAVLLGAWAARRRLLDDPERQARVLARGALVGLPLAVLGGLPLALMAASVWGEPPLGASVAAGVVHTVTGYADGIGYACLAGLVAIRVHRRPGPLGTALAACGQRSLTCYLAQSVVFVAVLAAYGGGLGDRVGVAATAGIAAVTWAVTVLAADGMRRLGRRGPFEVLLRRLSYPR